MCSLGKLCGIRYGVVMRCVLDVGVWQGVVPGITAMSGIVVYKEVWS